MAVAYVDAPPRAITAHLPAELTARAQWVCWRLETRGEQQKATKVPYTPRSGKKARAGDARTWGTYAEACAAYRRGGYDGLGYELDASDPFTGIDLDGCRDLDTGELSAWALDELDRFDGCYAELSPSGRGVHIWLMGTLAGQDGYHRTPYEAYSARHFLTVTGLQLMGTPAAIPDRQDALDAFCAEHFPAKAQQADFAAKREARLLSLDDDELVRRMCDRNYRARALWQGDATGYASASQADEALIAHLDWWTGGDAAQIERLMRASGLARDKHERPDYLPRSIAAWQADHPGASHYGDRANLVYIVQEVTQVEPAPAEDFLPGKEGDELARTRAALRLAEERIRHLEAERAEEQNWQRRLLANADLTAPYKLAAIAARWTLGRTYRPAPHDEEPRPIFLEAFGAVYGAAGPSASDHLHKLHEYGVVCYSVERTFDAATCTTKTHALLAPGPLLATPEAVKPEVPRNGWGGPRRRICQACGSDKLKTHTVCMACGTVQDDAHPVYASSAAAEDEPPPTEQPDTTAETPNLWRAGHLGHPSPALAETADTHTAWIPESVDLPPTMPTPLRRKGSP